MINLKNKATIVGTVLTLALVGCGGFVYTTVGGNVKGLTTDGQSTLRLGNEANFISTQSADGPFSFRVASNAAYSIRVVAQPNPVNCTVVNGTGKMTGETPVTNVAVNCVPNVQVSGTLNGLADATSLGISSKSGVVIDANTVAVSQLPGLAKNGAFSLPLYMVNGYKYSINIYSQPSAQVCTVLNGEGTADIANLPAAKNVVINCVAAVTIGGTITGLKTGLSLALSNGTSTLAYTAASTTAIPYVFRDSLLDGGAYDVQVTTQPVGQVCTVVNGTGIAHLPNSTTDKPNSASTIAINCI